MEKTSKAKKSNRNGKPLKNGMDAVVAADGKCTNR